MPRIAHVISTRAGFGGAERVMSSVVEGGHERGWAQLVLNPCAEDPKSPEIAGVCPVPVIARKCTRYTELPGVRHWLFRELKDFDPDIVQVYLFHASVLVASLRRRLGSTLVLSHQHGDHFVANGMRWQQALDRRAGTRFDRVVACSHFVESFLVEQYAYSPAVVSTITNGWTGRPSDRVGLAARPTAICVANFRAQKGHNVLLSAFDRVRHRMSGAQLVLVGSGDGRAEVEEAIRRLGLEAHVRLLGSVSDVWSHLEQAHVFALASSYEPLGVAVLEAMAAGLPVVASRVGGIPELVEDGVTGKLVEPGDDSELADAMLTLLASPDARARMGAMGRRLAAEHRSNRMVERYFGLYEELLST